MTSNRRRPLGRLCVRLARDERGFTIIEVVIAMLVFTVLIGAIATSQGSTMNLIRTDRHRSVAANLAADEMDTVRSTDFTDLPVGQTQTVRDVDGIQYTVTRESSWVTAGATSGACDAPSGADPAYLHVEVAVTWPVMSGVQPVRSSTIVTPPVGTYDENSGHIAVKVVDRDALPASGIQVSIAGPQNQSQVTTSDGCAFFAFLTPGTYTVTASATGYVDDQGVAAPTQPASVVVGGTTSILFMYDRAATLELTLLGKDTGSAAPVSVAVALYNSHIQPTGIQVFAGSGSPRQITGLFPYADGYEAWAGDCADADPVFYGAARDAPIATEPGQVTSGTVLLPEIRVTVQQDLGGGTMAPVPDRQVDVLHGPDPGCPAGATFPIGTTDAQGELVFAVPYGTWTVNVDGSFAGTAPLDPTVPPADGDGTWPFDVVVTQ